MWQFRSTWSITASALFDIIHRFIHVYFQSLSHGEYIICQRIFIVTDCEICHIQRTEHPYHRRFILSRERIRQTHCGCACNIHYDHWITDIDIGIEPNIALSILEDFK